MSLLPYLILEETCFQRGATHVQRETRGVYLSVSRFFLSTLLGQQLETSVFSPS